MKEFILRSVLLSPPLSTSPVDYPVRSVNNLAGTNLTSIVSQRLLKGPPLSWPLVMLDSGSHRLTTRLPRKHSNLNYTNTHNWGQTDTKNQLWTQSKSIRDHMDNGPTDGLTDWIRHTGTQPVIRAQSDEMTKLLFPEGKVPWVVLVVVGDVGNNKIAIISHWP